MSATKSSNGILSEHAREERGNDGDIGHDA